MGIGEKRLPIAGWHRGLSPKQIKAAKELKLALNYDFEEGSTYRAYNCLARIGISPMINRITLWRTMQLSRGHHLAFLYFLVLEHYKSLSSAYTNLVQNYTVNEQLLLSVIAYLDMPATLKELDRILPKNINQTKFQKPQSVKRKRLPNENKNLLPYFNKQPRPKQHATMPKYICTPPPFPADIGNAKHDWDVEDCWFANYKLQPNKRMVSSLISHELKLLFNKIDNYGTSASHSKSTGTNLQRLEFLIKQRDRCLAMLNLDLERKLISRERVLKHLNKDVESYLQKFGSPPLTNSHQSFEKELHILNSTDKGNRRQGLTVKNTPKQGSVSSIISCEGKNPIYTKMHCVSNLRKKSLHKCPGMLAVNNCFKQNGWDTLQEELNESSSDNQYFKATQTHVPHLFNYRDLLCGPCKIKQDAGQVIRGAFINALTKPDEIHARLNHWETLQRQNVMNAVHQCVHNIFKKGLLVEKKDEVSKSTPNRFDPNDDDLMEQMLYDGLKELRKNQKFVLAALPQSHQVPELREWIRCRYGKRYKAQTVTEFNIAYQDMIKAAQLDHTVLAKYIPKEHEGNPILNYVAAHRNPTGNEVDEYGKNFKNRFNDLMLDRSRVCWHSLNYLRIKNNESLRQAYFSYIPGCVSDMLPNKGTWLSYI